MRNRHLFSEIMRMTIPVMTGYLVLGIGFGMMLSASGLGPVYTALMAIFIYAGAMQYVAIGLLAAPFNPLGVLLLTLMVNARHIFYGFSLLEKYAGTGRVKPYLIFGLTDETYTILSVAKVPDGVRDSRFYFLVTLLNQLYWVAGCMAGAFIGVGVPLQTGGVEFAMTALFVAVFTERMMRRDERIYGAAGLGISALCLVLLGPDRFLVPAMALIVLALWLLSLRGGGEVKT